MPLLPLFPHVQITHGLLEPAWRHHFFFNVMEEAADPKKSVKSGELLLGAVSKPLNLFDARALWLVIVAVAIVAHWIAHVAIDCVFLYSKVC